MRQGSRRGYRETVEAVENNHDQLLERARAAHARRDFATAYRGLQRVRKKDGLQSEDLNVLAEATWWLGLTSETLALTEELHRRFLAEGKVDRAAINALELGFAWSIRGEHAIGSGWISRARRLLEDQPPSEAKGLLTYLDVSSALEAQELETVLTAARDLQRMGEQLASPTIIALALLSEGLALIQKGEVREGFALLDEAMLPVIADQVAPGWAGSIYCSIMLICHQLADLPRAREWTAATERWCDRFSDAVMFLGICRAHRVQLLNIEGAWHEAEREALRVTSDLADLNTEVVAETQYHLGEVYRFRGQVERASASFAHARELGRDPQPGESLLCLLTGEIKSGWAAISAALVGPGSGPFQRTRLLRAAVEIGLAGGYVDAAARASLELQETADLYRSPGFGAWADHARGAVILAQGHPELALPLLHRACQQYDQQLDPYDVARTQLLLARAHRDLGDLDAADGLTDTAEVAFRRLGAAAEMHPQVGSSPRLPSGLTDREVEVLTRIAGGISNRDAAAALFISEKTVRRHLANIYAKLGVGSRTAAAAWAYEQGLVHPAQHPS